MIDPIQFAINEVEMLLVKLHAMKPEIQQTIVDGQELQKDAKEVVAGVDVTPPPAA